MKKIDKGLKLYAFAKDKARELGVAGSKMKMEQLVWVIQEKEGNTPCFRRRDACRELLCCWQLSCGARMISS